MNKKRSVFAGLVIMALAFSACDQLKNMGVNKAEEEKKKMEEVAAQVAAKLAEEQKKAEEEKQRLQAQIDAEVQKKLAEKEAEMKKAAETQQAIQAAPTTQPAAAQPATPPPAAEPVKVVERVIIKEKEPAKPAPAQETPSQKAAEKIAAKLSGYVRLYDDKGFSDRSLTVRFGRDIGNMGNVSSDDGTSGFNDKATSVKYSIPAGYQVVLYQDYHFNKIGQTLKGTGSIAHFGWFSDRCSSLRWEKE